MTETIDPLEADVTLSHDRRAETRNPPGLPPRPLLPPDVATVVDSGIPPESAKLMILADCDLIASMKERLAQVALAAEVVKIETKGDAKSATATVILARKTRKQLYDRRILLRRPLDEDIKALMAPFRELEDAFDLIDKALWPKVVRYQDEVEARRIAAERESQRRELEALKAKEAEQLEQAETARSELAKDDAVATREQIDDLEAYDPAKDPIKVSTRTVVGSAHRRKDLSIEITAQNKVARRYIKSITIDRAVVKSDWKKGKREFPGLAVKEISTLGTR